MNPPDPAGQKVITRPLTQSPDETGVGVRREDKQLREPTEKNAQISSKAAMGGGNVLYKQSHLHTCNMACLFLII